MQHGLLKRKSTVPEKIELRFLADMGVSLRVASWLRDRGHDVAHLRDEGLHRMPDCDILQKLLPKPVLFLPLTLILVKLLLCLSTLR